MSTTTIREFDGGRCVELSSGPDFIVLEAGDHCFAFDRGIFIRAVERALGAVLLESGLVLE
ncbi:MAG: hypothetical protein BGN98_13605 [Microbacterium sp. 69-7]|uniref:hypothetical protein n=1 Tax=Microbacterium sp. 69-7 TaxID=1895784 RepID=UPI00095FF42A|nr:hypothetical protein [Microbacterium sp. 69-7]OJU44417.1 MAG: hypothetical protein BGN98_13605 [Microbacterium sp. 69-7]